MGYADGINDIGRTHVKSIFFEIEKVESSFALMINGDKTMYLFSGKREREAQPTWPESHGNL